MKRKLLVIGGLLAVILLGAGIFDYIPGFAVPSLRNQHLQSYCYSSGGDMLGRHHSTKVSRKDGVLLVSISDAGAHWMDNTTKEYLVEDRLLSELEAVFRKHKMQRWHEKRLSDVFVADGATYSYSFNFDEDRIRFSSQFFPRDYGARLKELHQLVEDYCGRGRLLPALVVPKLSPEAAMEEHQPRHGRVALRVCEYAGKRVQLRVSNGSDRELQLPESCRLYRQGEESPLGEYSLGRHGAKRVAAHETAETYFDVPDFLAAGDYRLELGKLACGLTLR